MAFVFSSLLEFAIVNAFARRLVPTSVSWEVVVESEPLTVKSFILTVWWIHTVTS